MFKRFSFANQGGEYTKIGLQIEAGNWAYLKQLSDILLQYFLICEGILQEYMCIIEKWGICGLFLLV